MHRVLVFFAFVALCWSAPYGDVNSQRSFSMQQDRQLVQQPLNALKVQQQDESEIVDTLGGGYSFFKKQPIVSRPLIQQKLAIHEQQVPISSFDDTSNQWSDYTRASAFKQLPAKTQQIVVSNDQVSNGYGQQQPLIRTTGNSYGQQQQQQDQILVQQQQPWTSNTGDSLGQEDVQVVAQQQPLIRTTGNSYGQQQQQDKIIVQQPLIRNTGNSYGQQEVRTLVQQQPLLRSTGSSYGQQQQDQILIQKQPLVRNIGNSYGQQQQQQDQVLIQQQPWTDNTASSLGQQNLQTLVQQQPLIRNTGNSYGQQEVRTLIKPQPLIRTAGNWFGQEDQSTMIMKSNNGLGQQIQQQGPLLVSQTISSVQPSFSSQQTDLPRNNGLTTSWRAGSQPQSSDSDSVVGW